MLHKVNYCSVRPTIQMEKILRNVCDRLFAQKSHEEIMNDTVLIPLIAQPYISKAKEWEHEKEYRLVFTKKILDDMNFEKKMCTDGKERYMYNVKIKKIFLGAEMSEEQKEDIRKIIPPGIEVVEMKISDTKYELLTQ